MAKTPDQSILQEAKDRFESCLSYYGEEYERGEEDYRFVMGITQWPPAVRAQRVKEGRPCLQQNELLPFVHQTINDIRQTRPSVNVLPVDDGADKITAEVLKGMIRNIETQSDASTAYDTAADNAIKAGYGWIRINTKYVSEESFDKEIEIKRVLNFQSVMLDPNCQEIDGSDAEYGFVYDVLTRDEFKRLYPKADPVNWTDFKGQEKWCDGDTVVIAEYFYKDYKNETIALLDDGSVVAERDVPEGVEPVKTRTVRIPSVKWCKLTAAEVLEETDWPGIYIPLIPVYGEETFYDNKRRIYSLIHQAKDPQQRLNYWISANTEIVAMAPRAPFIGPVGTFATHQAKWQSANTQTQAFLEYDVVYGENGEALPGPSRQQPPMGSPAMFQETLAATQGIKATLGIYDASLGAPSNEKSGKAIIARQQEGDNATFHFVDNQAKSIAFVGRQLVDLIPKVCTTAQIVRVLGDDGEPQNIPVNQPVVEQDGQIVPMTQENANAGRRFKIALDAGKYDVVCVVGPSYATKRQETAAQLVDLATKDPRLMEVAGDIIIESLDVDKADEIADRIRRAMPPNIVGGKDPAQQQLAQAATQIEGMQQQIVTLTEKLKEKQDNQQAENAYKMRDLDLKAKQIEIDAAKAAAEIAQIQAQAAVPPQAMEAVISTMETLDSRISDISEAVAHMLDHHEQQLMQQPTDVVAAPVLPNLGQEATGGPQPPVEGNL